MRISLPWLAVISVLAAVAQDQPVTPDNGTTIRGCVMKPGVYRFLPYGTVKTAIGESGGLMKGWADVAYLYRMDKEGASHQIAVPLGKIMRRQSPDIELQPGDLLYIPFAAGGPPKKRPDIIDVPPPGTERS